MKVRFHLWITETPISALPPPSSMERKKPHLIRVTNQCLSFSKQNSCQPYFYVDGIQSFIVLPS